MKPNAERHMFTIDHFLSVLSWEKSSFHLLLIIVIRSFLGLAKSIYYCTNEDAVITEWNSLLAIN